MTFAPVAPSTFISRVVASISIQQTSSTRATTPRKPAKSSGCAPTSPAVSRMVVERVPGHLFLVARARALGESGEERDQRDGIDHDEKHDEEFDELFDHRRCCFAQKLHIARSTHWELNGLAHIQTETAMNVIRPIVGQWYRGGTNELFEVVAIDDQDQTIEIQYFDGSVTEMDFDSWNEQLLDELIDAADPPEDWSGAVDVEAEDLGREFEDNARSLWSTPNDRSLRR
jgi:hypothetical protein